MFKTLDEIRKKNKEIGGYFFDGNSARYRRIYRRIYNGHFFIADYKNETTGKYSHSGILLASHSGRILLVESFNSRQIAKDKMPYYIEIFKDFFKDKEKTENNLFDFYRILF